MRTMMILITLGAAGAGYFYLNQMPLTGESYSSKSDSTPSLFDWNRDVASRFGSSRVPVNVLVNRIHEQTKSVLDDFANRKPGHSDAPVDDAFERLRQVIQSAAIPNSNSNGASISEVADWSKTAVTLPSLDELQRTAFDPEADAKPSNDLAVHTVDEPASASDAASNSKPIVAQETKGILESTTSASGLGLVPTTDSDSTPISNVSQKTASAASTRAAPIAPPKRETNVVSVEWRVVGKTTEGRPMHSAHFGNGGTRTLIIAGLNGEDRTAVRWLELLAEEVARQPALLKTSEFVFFRAGNPDGLVHNKRDNVRGVPLNRNFPSRRYRPALDMPKFAVPAGEIETRVMLDTLYTFRPRRVIHLAATNGRSHVLYNKLAKNTAVEFERSAKVGLVSLDVEQCPGSLEDFSDGTLEAAVMSMRLSVEKDWQQAWTKLQTPVLSAIVGHSTDPSTDADRVFDPDRTPIPFATSEPVARHPRGRGYEELPPPPQ